MAKILVIVSGKGGAGKSTAAVLLGKSLAAAGKKVLLIDADAGLNALDILTGVRETAVYHWGDALLGQCGAEDCIRDWGAGLSLISAPAFLREEYTPEKFTDFVKSVSDLYDFVLIDGPAGIGGGMTLAAAPAEKALVLSAPDDVSVNGCARAAERVLKAGPIQARLIINHFRFQAVRRCRQINIDNVIDRAGVQLIGIIPEDKNLWYFGTGGLLLRQNSPAIEAGQRIARRLLGEKVRLDLNQLK